MKKLSFVSFFLLLPLSVFCQIKFEKGYFIDNQGQRTECLIKNLDWNINPEAIEYKMSENADTETKITDDMLEFSIYGENKFIKKIVQIDRSSDNINSLSNKRGPEWSEEELLLEVLIEGEASLYSYADENVRRYFYSVNGGMIQQLIYKEFLSYNEYGDTHLMTNNTFHSQIFTDVNGTGLSYPSIQKLKYLKKDLYKYFLQYNIAVGKVFTNYEENKSERKPYHLELNVGANLPNISLYRSYYSILDEGEFSGNLGYKFGTEFQYVLPFNREKWTLLFGPSFNFYNATINPDYTFYYTDIILHYYCIELQIGAKYDMFLSQNTQFFLKAFYCPSFPVNDSKYEFYYYDQYLISSFSSFTHNIGIGGGMTYKRISLGIDYQFGRQMFSPSNWSSKYSGLSFTAGYRLF